MAKNDQKGIEHDNHEFEKKRRLGKDEYFMEIAKIVAKRSTCLRRDVGAVLVKESHIISTGYNGTPAGLSHCTPETCVRKKFNIPSGKDPHLCRAVHAELNCIIQAARRPISTAKFVPRSHG